MIKHSDDQDVNYQWQVSLSLYKQSRFADFTEEDLLEVLEKKTPTGYLERQ